MPTLFTAAQRSHRAPDLQAKASMLVVGLANSGKTSIVQALRAERSLDDTVPTVGFSVERFHMLNTMLTVVDMSGQPKYQKLWECYYDDVQVRCTSALLPAWAALCRLVYVHLTNHDACAKGGAQAAAHAAFFGPGGMRQRHSCCHLTAVVQPLASEQGCCQVDMQVCRPLLPLGASAWHCILLTSAAHMGRCLGHFSPKFVTDGPQGCGRRRHTALLG